MAWRIILVMHCVLMGCYTMSSSSRLNPEDGGSIFFGNIGTNLAGNAAWVFSDAKTSSLRYESGSARYRM